MRVRLVGGIFGKDGRYQRSVPHTPEAVLAQRLVELGYTVQRQSHFDLQPLSDCDLIHIHHLSYGALQPLIERTRTPFVFTPHGMADRFVGWRRRALGSVLRRADVAVALSETEARWQRRHCGVLSSRQRVIPNGIDSALFQYVPPPKGDRFRILFVGQLIPLKGARVLIAALARVRASVNAEVRLAYQMADQEIDLRRQVERLGLSKHVSFLGRLSPEVLHDEYAAAHVLALPSFAEALPSSVSEALCVGRPVVASDVGAIAEQVGTFGRVVPAGDPRALACALASVLTDYKALAQGSEEKSRHAAMRYSIREMVLRHEEVYRELIGRTDTRDPGRAKRVAGTVGRRALRAIARRRLEPRALR